MTTAMDDIKALITLDPTEQRAVENHLEKIEPNEPNIFNLGLRYYKYGELERSLVFFSKVLEMNPQNGKAYCNIGNIFYKKERYEEAANFWKYAIKLDATCENAYWNLGNYYFSKKDYNEAISYYIIFYSMDPNNMNLLLQLGLSYIHLENSFLADFFNSKYLQKSVDAPGGINYMKVVSHYAKSRKKALKYLKYALYFQKKKKYLKALEMYLGVLNVYPSHYLSNLNAGSILYQNEKYEEAKKYWLRAYLLKNDKVNLFNLCIVFDKLEEYSYAIACFKRYLKGNEDLSFEKVKIEDRIKKLEKLIGDINPYYSQHCTKGEDFLKKKDYVNAHFEFSIAHALKPESDEINKKIDIIQKLIYPEKNIIKQWILIGDRALENLQILEAVHYYKSAYRINQDEHMEEFIKNKMSKCARLMKKYNLR